MKAPTWLAKLIIDVVEEEELLTPTPSSCVPRSAASAASAVVRAKSSLSRRSSESGTCETPTVPKSIPKRLTHGFTPAVVSPRTELAANLWAAEARAQLDKLSSRWKEVERVPCLQRDSIEADLATQGSVSESMMRAKNHDNKNSIVPSISMKRTSPKPVNTKTILCKYYLKGNCVHGVSCSFAHGEKELLITDQDRRNQRHEKLKTKPCKNLHESGYCQFGPKCLFLHSPAETKRSKSPTQLQNTEKLYKTEPCRHFFKTGVCMFGEKCMFAHGREERRHKMENDELKSNN